MVLNTKQWKRITIVFSCLPGIYILLGSQLNWLGFNPSIKAIEISGNWAVVFFLLSLAARPLKEIGIKFGMKIRRQLGLASFFYGLTHLLIYVFWNYGGNIRLVLSTLSQQKFIFLGIGGLFVMLVLAVTSNTYSVRLLKKGWQRVHRFTYVIGPLILFHLLFASKSNQKIFIIYGITYVLLMLMRVPSLIKGWQKKKSTS